mmetsp:Transcript_33119/g.57217  ORF Transcript_33119/g.57217 Transcript_33119/m.57217 type:complete len:216 (-) Transcript_33119:297-944(-)
MQTLYFFLKSMGRPCTKRLSFCTRLPSFASGSKAKVTPETCGNLPSSRGCLLTPFSRAASTLSPVISITAISSHMGSSWTRSRILKGPGSKTQSALRVPEFNMVMSALAASLIMSATRFPIFVSIVRIEANLLSSATAEVPSGTSISPSTIAWYLATTAFASASSGTAPSTTIRSWSRTTGLPPAASKPTVIKVASRKSVPLLTTGGWPASAITS